MRIPADMNKKCFLPIMRDESRGDIAWSKVLKLLVTNCLIDPASEFYVHRQWFDKTAGAGIYSRQFQI